MSATELTRSLSVAAILGGALIYLFFVARMGGVAAPLDRNRGGPAVPASVESAHAASPSRAHLPSSSYSDVKFRFGFLEFEDDPDPGK